MSNNKIPEETKYQNNRKPIKLRWNMAIQGQYVIIGSIK